MRMDRRSTRPGIHSPCRPRTPSLGSMCRCRRRSCSHPAFPFGGARLTVAKPKVQGQRVSGRPVACTYRLPRYHVFEENGPAFMKLATQTSNRTRGCGVGNALTHKVERPEPS